MDDPDDLLTVIRRILDRPELLLPLRELGYHYVVRERMQHAQARDRYAWYQDLVARRSELERARQARLASTEE